MSNTLNKYRLKRHSLPDLQSESDPRQISLHQAGIKRLKHPVQFRDFSADQPEFLVPTIGVFSLSTRLPKNQKGTHLSRLVDILNQKLWILEFESIRELLIEIANKLGLNPAYLTVKFPIFIEKTAPISKKTSLLDYQIQFSGKYTQGTQNIKTTVHVPVTTLCPCSKAISEYGAHNQRTIVKLSWVSEKPVSIRGIIKIIEQSSSCELFSLLKRSDEKYITEYAYNHPKFTEDLVRDLVQILQTQIKNRILPEFSEFNIQAESLESIHNHSAFASFQFKK